MEYNIQCFIQQTWTCHPSKGFDDMFNPKVRLVGSTWSDRLAQCLFVLSSQRVGIDQLALNLLAVSFARQILLLHNCVTYKYMQQIITLEHIGTGSLSAASGKL